MFGWFLTRKRWLATAAAFLFLVPTLCLAQPADPVRYTVRISQPHTHYVEVAADIPTGKQPQVELMMAVWTPGSYLVREYERHVEDVTARGPAGTSLAVRKTRKNRWQIQTNGAATVSLSYRVYCREMTVRNNWVEADFAMLNGAPTFLTLADGKVRPHDVTLVLPDTWKTSISGLPEAPDGAPHHYLAPDFDTLVDSPIVAGNPAIYQFEVDGKPHYLVNVGEGGVWDGARTVKDVETIVRQNLRMWGSLPYPKYVFLNMITESGGGLEHKTSTLLMTSRWQIATHRGYLDWLGLVSHEYFHAWNVKLLRPVELGPFDYENEVYTKGLWVAEGFTSYYGDLNLRRAGLMTQEEYLAALSDLIGQLQTTPGRLVQPVEMSSYDAWIKQYRPDENSDNTTISYYTKGAVIALLLDAKIRHATAGAKSLDDVMRLAFTRYGGERGFTGPEFRTLAQEVAGVDLGAWFGSVLETTDELDYSETLDWFGLHFKTPEPPKEGEPERGWLGMSIRNQDGRVVVAEVLRDTPAYEAGVNVEDEVVAINDYRVTPAQLQSRFDQYKPGDHVSVLVARRGHLVRLDVTLGKTPADVWQLEVRPDASDEQKARLSRWLQPTASGG